MSSTLRAVLSDGVSPLPDLGVIRVEGDDAVRFLQGQLTQDFALLGDDQARLAAFCSAKGRMQASFIGLLDSPGSVLLVTRLDTLAPTLKRLSMFVLRAKARLSDASDDYVLRGLSGTSVPQGLGVWQRRRLGPASVVGLYPADDLPRALWIAPGSTPEPEGPVLDAAAWRLGEVRSGVAMVCAPVVDAFVPQMLNYESVGGVSFRKGCYPGQEVVARSQFRGTLKRRAFLLASGAPMASGTELFDPAAPEEPCGLIALAAEAPDGGHEAIACLQLGSASAPELRVGAPDGPAATVRIAPYPLLADI